MFKVQDLVKQIWTKLVYLYFIKMNDKKGTKAFVLQHRQGQVGTWRCCKTKAFVPFLSVIFIKIQIHCHVIDHCFIFIFIHHGKNDHSIYKKISVTYFWNVSRAFSDFSNYHMGVETKKMRRYGGKGRADEADHPATSGWKMSPTA